MHDEESGDIIRIAKGTIGSTAFPGDLHHSREEGIDMEVFEEGEEGDERGREERYPEDSRILSRCEED